MNGREDKQKPAGSARGRADAEAREARRAEALRENLKRRKAQARGRDENAGEAGTGGSEGGSSGAAGKDDDSRPA